MIPANGSKIAHVEDGKLIIEARRDNWEGKADHFRQPQTKGKTALLYGRIEARAKVPTGRGTWPAIWTLGERQAAGWPACGEIDILENVGFGPSRVHANIHCKASQPHDKNGQRATRSMPGRSPGRIFTLYAIEWYGDRIEFFFDDTRYFVYRTRSRTTLPVWPLATPHYLILNLAIGAGAEPRASTRLSFPIDTRSTTYGIIRKRHLLPKAQAQPSRLLSRAYNLRTIRL